MADIICAYIKLKVVLTPSQVAKLSVIEKSKRLAAFAAVDEHLLSEHKVCGVRYECFNCTSAHIHYLLGDWYWIWFVRAVRSDILVQNEY